MLNKHKIPLCLDEYGTPLVRFKEVREFSQTFESQSITNKILNRLFGKGIAMRIGIKKVGCTGLAHTFDIADEIRPTDHSFESHDARLLIDADSLPFLDGSRIDFSDSSMASIRSCLVRAWN